MAAMSGVIGTTSFSGMPAACGAAASSSCTIPVRPSQHAQYSRPTHACGLPARAAGAASSSRRTCRGGGEWGAGWFEEGRRTSVSSTRPSSCGLKFNGPSATAAIRTDLHKPSLSPALMTVGNSGKERRAARMVRRRCCLGCCLQQQPGGIQFTRASCQVDWQLASRTWLHRGSTSCQQSPDDTAAPTNGGKLKRCAALHSQRTISGQCSGTGSPPCAAQLAAVPAPLARATVSAMALHHLSSGGVWIGAGLQEADQL